MRLLADFHDRGGRVVVGTDSGFMYHLHGFGYVRELEMLRQAGLSPLEVLRAATLDGARALGMGDHVGSVEPGKLADLVVVEADPLADFKVLYGTGALRFDDEGRESRVGGVRWTIKGGVVYDAKALLAEVAAEVAAAKGEARAGGL
jgi:cytosine/adenosine deaminase-related metal-dependent hydrolase